jgi:large subunit ribosomal protein L22
MTTTFATLKNARISPQKVRLFRPLLKGASAVAAEQRLLFMAGKAPKLLREVLRSAMANATNNFEADRARLTIQDLIVNAGYVLKRHQAVSRGSAHPILKRTAHVTVVVAMPDTVKQAKRKKAAGILQRKPAADVTPATPASETPHAHGKKDKGAPQEKREVRDRNMQVQGKIKTMQQGGEAYKTHRRKSM